MIQLEGSYLENETFGKRLCLKCERVKNGSQHFSWQLILVNPHSGVLYTVVTDLTDWNLSLDPNDNPYHLISRAIVAIEWLAKRATYTQLVGDVDIAGVLMDLTAFKEKAAR